MTKPSLKNSHLMVLGQSFGLFLALFLGSMDTSLAQDCGMVPTPQALQKYQACVAKGSVKGSPQNAVIIDADAKCLWVIDGMGNGQAKNQFKITIGSASGGPPAHLGNEGGSDKTPPGLLVTKEKTESSVFSGPDKFIGLDGKDSTNDQTYSRGVYIHAAEGPTQGCIGIVGGRYQELKQLLAQGGGQTNANGVPDSLPIFVWGSLMNGSGCDGTDSSNGNAGGSTGGGTGNSSPTNVQSSSR